MDYNILAISLAACIVNIMFLCFLKFLRLLNEERWKININPKHIPQDYMALPYSPHTKRQEIITLIAICIILVINLIHNNWWSSIAIFLIGRVFAEILTRVFIYKRRFWSIISISQILTFCILLYCLI